MKLGDFRKKLRKRPAVDELDEFLVEKGAMAPGTELVGGAPWPIEDAPPTLTSERFKSEAMGEWRDEDLAAVLPPSLAFISAPKARVHAKLDKLADRPGYVGSYVYDLKMDDLCQIKRCSSAVAEATSVYTVWYGARDTKGQPVCAEVPGSRLYPIGSALCSDCEPSPSRCLGPCVKCNDLGRRPRAADLRPFRDSPERGVMDRITGRRRVR